MKEGTAIASRVLAAKSDILAADALICDYLPFIKSETCKTIGHIVVEGRDDELSIAMIAFHEAIGSYSQLKGSFLKYASVVMRRKLIDYYRKEKRYMGMTSIDEPIADEETKTIAESIADKKDHYDELSTRDATKAEIDELAKQLAEFEISLTDIAENSPKQDRTLSACHAALDYAKKHHEIITELKSTKRLPLSKLTEGADAPRKTLERHRKYIVALLIIYSNGYEIIRGHLKQVLPGKKGGAE